MVGQARCGFPGCHCPLGLLQFFCGVSPPRSFVVWRFAHVVHSMCHKFALHSRCRGHGLVMMAFDELVLLPECRPPAAVYIVVAHVVVVVRPFFFMVMFAGSPVLARF